VTELVGGALASALDGLLRRVVRRGRGVRHGLLTVADAGGSWIWRGAEGVADPTGAPVTVEARYPVASVTKLFTAVVVMRLVEQGRVTLEDRLVEVLPAETTARLHVLEGVERTHEITIEHLLSHTSGLPDYYTQAPRGGRSPEARLLDGEDVPVPFDEVLRLVREELAPRFPPQPRDASKRRAAYADTNFQLLGAAVEEVTGQALRTVLDDMLFGPLRLDDTSSYPHLPRSGAAAEPTVAVGSGSTVLALDGALTHQVADGGMISTLADQARFLGAVVSGEVFEHPGTWQRMHQHVNRVFFPVDYGLGVMRYAPPRWMSPLVGIPPVVGHSGSTASWLFHCPELGIVTAGTFDVVRPPLPFRFLPQVLRTVARVDPGS